MILLHPNIQISFVSSAQQHPLVAKPVLLILSKFWVFHFFVLGLDFILLIGFIWVIKLLRVFIGFLVFSEF